MNKLNSGGHCGNVNFTPVTDKDPDSFVPRCSCSMCRKHGASYISDPEARLMLRYRDGSKRDCHESCVWGHNRTDGGRG